MIVLTRSCSTYVQNLISYCTQTDWEHNVHLCCIIRCILEVSFNGSLSSGCLKINGHRLSMSSSWYPKSQGTLQTPAKRMISHKYMYTKTHACQKLELHKLRIFSYPSMIITVFSPAILKHYSAPGYILSKLSAMPSPSCYSFMCLHCYGFCIIISCG